jgi:hypothetical protein
MNKDQAIDEMNKLRQFWDYERELAESDGNSDFATLSGAISAIDTAIKIVKEIE